MVNTNMFKHPKYYKELRKRNKETQQELQRILDKPGRSVSNSDQVISGANATAKVQRAPGPGLVCAFGRKATSHKHQASSVRRQAPEASSDKHQAPSSKRQA